MRLFTELSTNLWLNGLFYMKEKLNAPDEAGMLASHPEDEDDDCFALDKTLLLVLVLSFN